MNQIKLYWKLGLAAVAPLMVAGQTIAEDDPPKATKTTTVVVSGADGDLDEVLERVRAQLEKSGISEEQREKILSQVRESIENASNDKVGRRTIRLRGKNLDVNPKRLSEMIQGRVLQGMSEGGPSYRIGISLTARIEDEEDDEDGDDEEDDEDEDEDDEEEGEDSMEGDDEEDESENTVLMVEEVLEDSPASKAGIHTGDIVLSVNGQKVKVFTEVQQAVQESGKKEKPVVLQVMRDGKDITVQVIPTKTDESDVGVMDLNLVPLQEMVIGRGFVFGDEGKNSAEFTVNSSNAGAWTMTSGDESLKKEVEQLRSEIAELKEMIQKLLAK